MKKEDVLPYIKCPNCKGEGHVLGGAGCFPIFGQLLALVERNDKDRFTRNKCSHCEGEGLVNV